MYDRQVAQFLNLIPIQYTRGYGSHRSCDGWRQYFAPSIRQGFAQIKQSTTYGWVPVKHRKKNRTTNRGRCRANASGRGMRGALNDAPNSLDGISILSTPIISGPMNEL